MCSQIGLAILDLVAVCALGSNLFDKSGYLLAAWLLTVVKIMLEMATVCILKKEHGCSELGCKSKTRIGLLISVGACLQLVIVIIVSILYGEGKTVATFALVVITTILCWGSAAALYAMVASMSGSSSDASLKYQD